jgi:hypothetical protein
MARVQVNREVVRRVKDVTLTLNEDEANTLAAIMGHIGGRADSPRKHTTAILSALSGAGFKWYVGDVLDDQAHPARLVSGSLRFADYPNG